ncbi:pentatricopeptide repeat domain containing protein [Babesia ovata]|uniref:Pentatricopeptide repeat domain containing protein n=1 Tax=Babesia ovata TaxID=189622 RepID=A0A2H6K6K6_9APIC|nr:pentatricopeptide repeat domain containing protein [Babesia ovata]GBE58633.1 pentatricopeptide repeat domain containing protein [Babesia ovata]
MDNVNPVLYKKTNGPSTTESQERFVLSTKEKSFFYIDHHMALDSDDEAKAVDKAANNLFKPTTEFEPFEVQEIFDIIRGIKDPEYSYTLENLKVLEEQNIHIDNDNSIVTVHFTPTVPHCSQATVIGLMIYVKLQQSLPPRFKIDVQIAEGDQQTTPRQGARRGSPGESRATGDDKRWDILQQLIAKRPNYNLSVANRTERHDKPTSQHMLLFGCNGFAPPRLARWLSRQSPHPYAFVTNAGVICNRESANSSCDVNRGAVLRGSSQRTIHCLSRSDGNEAAPNPPMGDQSPTNGDYMPGFGSYVDNGASALTGGLSERYAGLKDANKPKGKEPENISGEVTEDAQPGEITDEDVMKMKVALSQATTLGIDFVKCIETLQTSPYSTVSPTTIAYNSALSAAERNSNAELTLAILDDMRKKQNVIDAVSYKLAICTCAKCGYTHDALQLYDEMIQNKHAADHGVMRAIMAQLAKEGRGMECSRIFQDMKKLDAVAKGDETFVQPADCLKVIEACSKAQMYGEAFEVYKEMKQLKNYVPTPIVVNEVLSMCYMTGNWRDAMELYAGLVKENKTPTLHQFKLLLSTLLVSRKFTEMESVYNQMQQESIQMDAVSYQLLLDAYAKTGQFKKALKIIEDMEKQRLFQGRYEPFISAVEACRQSGEWKLALQLLRKAHDHNEHKSIDMYNAVLAVFSVAEEWDSIISLHREIDNVCKESSGTVNNVVMNGDTVAYAAMAYFYTGDRTQTSKLLQLPVTDTPLLLKIRSGIQAEILSEAPAEAEGRV